MGEGVTFKELSSKKLGKVKIKFPSIPEQQRIATILAAAFADLAQAKANAEKNLANTKELFASELYAVFTHRGVEWDEKALGDCARFIDYRGKTPDKTNSGLRLITAKNVKMGYIQRYPEEFVAETSYESWMTRGIPHKGDVLFTTEAPLANVAQLDTDDRVVFAQRVIILQSNKTYLYSAFLKYALMSIPVQKIIHSKGTGATATGIKSKLLKTISIPFPSLAEQQRIAARLDELSEHCKKLEAVYTQKLSLYDEMKQSLLRKAFSGEL